MSKPVWHKGECIEATGRLDKGGYGKKKIDGKSLRAHRVSYCQHHGIPIESIKGLFVLHICDNPPCINPNHLRLGTSRDNIDDMLAKNRQLQGESCNNVKLTESSVKTIRDLYQRHSRVYGAKYFAEKFGVSRRAISAIILGATWKHTK